MGGGALGGKGLARKTLKAPLFGLRVAKLIMQQVLSTCMLSPQRAHPLVPAHLLTHSRPKVGCGEEGVRLGKGWARGSGAAQAGSSVPHGQPHLVIGLCLSIVGRDTLSFSGHERDLERSKGAWVLLPLQGASYSPLSPQDP